MYTYIIIYVCVVPSIYSPCSKRIPTSTIALQDPATLGWPPPKGDSCQMLEPTTGQALKVRRRQRLETALPTECVTLCTPLAGCGAAARWFSMGPEHMWPKMARGSGRMRSLYALGHRWGGARKSRLKDHPAGSQLEQLKAPWGQPTHGAYAGPVIGPRPKQWMTGRQMG